MKNKKIALVCQRYGVEVNGGAEYYARVLAEHLSKIYDIEVLTTKAVSHTEWNNWYSEEYEMIDGIKIRRFSVEKKRDWPIMNLVYGSYKIFHFNFNCLNNLWIKAQGPYVPEMINFIDINKKSYDVFIFITYLYYPTVFGLPLVREKSIFVPTAHEEYAINFNIYKKLFILPRAIVYLSEEEKSFVHNKFKNQFIKNEIMAMGIELPSQINHSNMEQKYSLPKKYLLYVGRVETEKNCDEMFDFFIRFTKENQEFCLVVMGKTDMDIPLSDHIKYLGYLSERDKLEVMKNAYMLWIPSKFESLSIVLLESMSLGIPVIVNGKSNVLLGHCKRSNAGINYFSYYEFENKLLSLTDDKYKDMRNKAIDYVDENYQWSVIMEKWINLIEGI